MAQHRFVTVPDVGVSAGPAAEPNVRKTLFRGALGSLLVQVGGLGAAFGSQVGLAHLLGAGAFGQYAYVIACVSLLCVLGRAGLDLASLRLIPEYRTHGQHGLLRGFVARSVLVAALISSAISVLGLGVAVYFSASLEPGLYLAALPGLALIPILTLQGIFTGQLRALKHVVLGQLPKQILSPVAIVGVTFLIVALTGHAARATTALGLSVIINMALTVLAGIVALRHLRPHFGTSRPEVDRQSWLACSLPLLFVAIVQMINFRVDVLMVGGLLGMKEAGIYTAAAQLAGLVTLGLVGVNTIAAPMIAELHAKGRARDFQNFLTQAARMIFLMTVPLAVVLLCAGTRLLGLFGGEFTVGSTALFTLVMGHAVSALAGPVGFLVIMTGNQREGAWILGGAAVLNVVMNAVLIPRFGLVGAATATAITTCVWNLLMLVFVARRLSVNPTVFPYPKSR